MGGRQRRWAEAIFAFWRELFESFRGEDEMEIEEVSAGGDCVVLGVHTQGRGKTSGVPVDVRWALAFSFREGKIAQVDVRGDYAKAVKAAGLSEYFDHAEALAAAGLAE